MSPYLGDYHIATLEQLAELPSSLTTGRLAKGVANVVRNYRLGDTVTVAFFGDTVTMPYEVAQHIVAVYNLEGGE